MKSVRVTDALKGLDFKLLLAQGVAKGEGDRPKNKNRYATRTCICAYAKQLSSEKMLGKLIDISLL